MLLPWLHIYACLSMNQLATEEHGNGSVADGRSQFSQPLAAHFSSLSGSLLIISLPASSNNQKFLVQVLLPQVEALQQQLNEAGSASRELQTNMATSEATHILQARLG